MNDKKFTEEEIDEAIALYMWENHVLPSCKYCEYFIDVKFDRETGDLICKDCLITDLKKDIIGLKNMGYLNER